MLMTFKNFGIHARVLSAALVLISASTLTLGYLGVNIINQFVLSRFSQRIDSMTQYLALNSELGILIDEEQVLKGLARNMLKENDIASVFIEGSKGKKLVKESREISGPFKTIQKWVNVSRVTEENVSMDLTGGNINLDRIGRVEVTYSTKGIEDLIEKMKNRFMLSAVILIFISCGIFYFISKSLVAPVILLAKIARKVSSGNQLIRAPAGNTPETIKLSNAFNDMLDSISKGRQTIVHAYEKMAKQEALAEMGKFSMLIAHEVKNPLGIIKSSLEMLKEQFNIQRDNIPLVYAEEEIVRLNDLIESFLMFARPARPNFKKTDLNKLIYQVVTGFEIQYNDFKIKIHSSIPEQPFYSNIDFDLFSRGITNIITNACESGCKEKTIIDIAIKCQDTKWQLLIKDNGSGIPEDKLGKIFEPFFTTKSKGTGLGLAFADQVIKAHGGNIKAENLAQGGALFCITIFSGMKLPQAVMNGELPIISNGNL